MRESGPAFTSGTGAFPEFEGMTEAPTTITKVANWSVGTSSAGNTGLGPLDPDAVAETDGPPGEQYVPPAVPEMDAALLAAMEAAGPLIKTEKPRQALLGYENTALFHREKLQAQRREKLRPGARPEERVLPTQRMSFVESAFETYPGRLNPTQMLELLELAREDPATHDAAALSERFGVSEHMVADMIHACRVPRLTGDPTKDETVYGFWD